MTTHHSRGDGYAMILFYAYRLSVELGDGQETNGSASMRSTFLAPLANQDNPTDDVLRRLLERANALRN